MLLMCAAAENSLEGGKVRFSSLRTVILLTSVMPAPFQLGEGPRAVRAAGGDRPSRGRTVRGGGRSVSPAPANCSVRELLLGADAEVRPDLLLLEPLVNVSAL